MTDSSRAMSDDRAEPPKVYPYAPRGYRTITPFIAVRGGGDAIDFYARAFGACVLSRMDGEGGTVMHAELMIGDSIILMSDEIPSMNILAPDGTTVHGSFSFYVPDVDDVFARAVAAGAKPVSTVEDVFSGDRMGVVMCPFGHRWVILTKVDDIPTEEIERRAREWMDAQAGADSA